MLYQTPIQQAPRLAIGWTTGVRIQAGAEIYLFAVTSISIVVSKPWSVILTKNIRIKVLENRRLGNIFFSERETVPGGREELHNEEFLAMYSSPNIIRAIKKMAKNEMVTPCGAEEKYFQGFGGDNKGKGTYRKTQV